ncbi:hypothetical protein HaLaN_24186 [Haematococcus lacustris]|uniref:Uncharacterized protein n=1 Tax=Haematococcus lacustris TaxID=44745 RepID=A0A6A0A324_HAELA|nr:hypothetical protein HaLaN_24186 [Haematococcus lacustris]
MENRDEDASFRMSSVSPSKTPNMQACAASIARGAKRSSGSLSWTHLFCPKLEPARSVRGEAGRHTPPLSRDDCRRHQQLTRPAYSGMVLRCPAAAMG